MAINKKIIHFKKKEDFDNEVANGNILNHSIVFIQDTQLIYTHGTFYDGSTVDLSNIEASIENILNNKAYKEEIYSKKEIDIMLSVSKYEFVDLELPSGLKWATCNVGANSPERYGLYFAWGETEGYISITSDKKFTWADYKLCNGSNTTLTKYNDNSYYGAVDNLTTLEQIDDAAYQSDNTCRMPTKADFEELIANTTSTWETLNGVNGMRFTGTNGNSIFIPAAGHFSESLLYSYNASVYVWSSLIESYFCYSGFSFNCYNNFARTLESNRNYGMPIRAVKETNSSIFDPNNYYTKEYINEKIPTKVSELENDVPYLTEHQDISHLASKDDVNTAISELVDSAPETLNTLNELATAITEHQDVTDVLDAAISNKLDKTEAETIYQPIGDYATKDDIKTSGALTLRAYIFNVSGTYTKTELEALLGVELSVLINSMKKGNPITIFSSDDVSCNISFVVESNCTITTEGELESLTLFWHQYQLWNTVSISLDSSGNYVMSNTTSS